jgi:two-component system LytT family sensor kinase
VTALVVAGLLAGLGMVIGVRKVRARRTANPEVDLITDKVLHSVFSAQAVLRDGPGPDLALHLRVLLRTPGLAIIAADGTVLDCDGEAHSLDVRSEVADVALMHTIQVLGPDRMLCEDPNCPVRYAIVAPLLMAGRTLAVLAVYTATAPAGMVRAVSEAARWTSDQLELGELDKYKVRLAEAELRAHRAQIAPHFIYNAMTTIAALVRSDPEQARELLIDFADFTRYSFSKHGQFTTLAEELRSIERYLTLERARFGARLIVTLRISPEVLPVVMPFLCLQPLVENAVQHGMGEERESCHITIVAEDGGAEVWISVEDDGAGMDPEACLETVLDGTSGKGIGLRNINERMRQVYGKEYALVVDTEIGAGTKVWMRVPKYRVGVYASRPR